MPSIFDGPAGESLFHTPYQSLDSTAWWNQNMVPLFSKIGSADDRSNAMMAALVLEERLDVLLTLWLPGFVPLAKDRDLTLSMKIKLLRAAKLVPAKIVSAADCLRGIRNEFAHQLKIERFDQLAPGRVEAMRAACREFHLPGHGSWIEVSDTPRKLFDSLTMLSVMGLHSFEINLRVLRLVISRPDFEVQLRAGNHKEFQEAVEALSREASQAGAGANG